MARASLWNHNIHYHSVVLGALPRGCGRVLDVGCGEGVLAHELSGVVESVTAIDADRSMIEVAQARAAVTNIDYVVGDFLTQQLEPASFDAVVSVAALHHMDTAEGLTRMEQLLRPGGTLVVIGLARSHSLKDLVFDIAGAVATRAHRLTKTYRETAAPKVWPPPETFAQTHRVAARVLPGARFTRHVLWRYSLVWKKPD